MRICLRARLLGVGPRLLDLGPRLPNLRPRLLGVRPSPPLGRREPVDRLRGRALQHAEVAPLLREGVVQLGLAREQLFDAPAQRGEAFDRRAELGAVVLRGLRAGGERLELLDPRRERCDLGAGGLADAVARAQDVPQVRRPPPPPRRPPAPARRASRAARRPPPRRHGPPPPAPRVRPSAPRCAPPASSAAACAASTSRRQRARLVAGLASGARGGRRPRRGRRSRRRGRGRPRSRDRATSSRRSASACGARGLQLLGGGGRGRSARGGARARAPGGPRAPGARDPAAGRGGPRPAGGPPSSADRRREVELQTGAEAQREGGGPVDERLRRAERRAPHLGSRARQRRRVARARQRLEAVTALAVVGDEHGRRQPLAARREPAAGQAQQHRAGETATCSKCSTSKPWSVTLTPPSAASTASRPRRAPRRARRRVEHDPAVGLRRGQRVVGLADPREEPVGLPLEAVGRLAPASRARRPAPGRRAAAASGPAPGRPSRTR